MRRLMLVAALAAVLSTTARAQMMEIEGVVHHGVEGGCWLLECGGGPWGGSGLEYNIFGGGPDLYREGIFAVCQGYAGGFSYCMQGTPFHVVSYSIGGSGVWWPPSTCAVSPAQPTALQTVAITLGGEWNNVCTPNGSRASVINHRISIDVLRDYPQGTNCPSVAVPWSRSVTVGPLEPGPYVITASRYEGSQLVAGPAQCAQFTVLPGPKGDCDNDGDVDLADFALFQACFSGPNRPPTSVTGCAAVDLDDDGDVDLADFGVFQRCFNGPNRAAACS
jgi:hypothetical protein